MNIVTDPSAWQQIRKSFNTKSIGFVPTMGHLHAGHQHLYERSLAENEITVASLFINPTQFNQESDYANYPRTIEHDCEILAALNVDYVFMPETKAMYPDDYQFKIEETQLSKELEGEFRPGHFTGMLTIVLKLLNLIQPTRAYFGEKDFQQLLLIKKMVSALFIPVDIIACETVRAPDGLALSSRNSRLNEKQRKLAASFPEILQRTKTPQEATEQLHLKGFKVEYVTEKWGRRLAAIWLDDVRLIDNIGIP